ncbi:MAG TPA: Uma2 family endonuclease [Candidatus Eremiobacteraceae bacterium]|nr:Uma2 family endonuclease [Candidatus Eremiobacteraceae bacterium]
MQEIVLPDNVKPALEWVNNRVLQKVSPQRKHALAQRRFASALGCWADDGRRGTVGTEWRFQVRPPNEIRRTLVPDVAFLSFDRLPYEEQERTEIPVVAPDVVVEVRSPDDRQVDIDEKVRVYLAAGTTVIFLVDPAKRSVIAIDKIGARDLSNGPVRHHSLPGFSFEPALLFDMPRPKQHR